MLQHLPDVIIRMVVEDHLTDLEAKTMRLVSKECRSLVDRYTSALKPRDFTSSQVGAPALIQAVLLSSLILLCLFNQPAYFERKVGPTSSSPEGYASPSMQHGELASLFANLQSLQLTAHSMTTAYDAQWQRLEQLTSLTGLSCLKIEGNWSWGNTDLYKVRPFNSRLASCAVEQWASIRPFTPTLRGSSQGILHLMIAK